jgi:hypothetical protein
MHETNNDISMYMYIRILLYKIAAVKTDVAIAKQTKQAYLMIT